VGIVLSLIRAQGDQHKVDELFARLPGAEGLAARHAGASSGGGLAGLFGGAFGGPLAAIAKLQAAGLSMDEINVLGRELLGVCPRKGGRASGRGGGGIDSGAVALSVRRRARAWKRFAGRRPSR
jgi:hypothetical protein